MSVHTFDYTAAFNDFKSRLSPQRKVQFKEIFQKSQHEFKFDEMRSLLSVGPGDGDIDREILASFPRCATYIGVEPRADVLSQLQHNLEGLVETVELHAFDVQEFQGPQAPVDVILLSHVLYGYYVSDRKLVIARCMKWLRPGGLMIIIISDQQDWISGLPFSAIHSKIIISELKDLRLNIIKERSYPCQLDVSNKTKEFANFCWQRDCTKSEEEAVYRIIDKEGPLLPNSSTVIIVQK